MVNYGKFDASFVKYKMKYTILNLKLAGVIIVLTGIMCVSSCTNDNLEDLSKTFGCDTTSISYKIDIAPLFQASCSPCHAINTHLPNGTVRLDEYQFLAPRATENNLLCRIKHTLSCSPMPRNADKLPPCDIEKIQAWVDQGAQDN